MCRFKPLLQMILQVQLLYFNTSYVSVQEEVSLQSFIDVENFNTSYVSVQGTKNK